MPTGVYKRTPEMMEAVKRNLEKGRSPDVRRKVRLLLIQNAKSEEWRQKVSDATKSALHRPSIRRKHLAALRRFNRKNGPNFKGGNGQEMTPETRIANGILAPKGYVREFIIPTANHATRHKPPPSYKADFAHPKNRIVIELDGVSHRRQLLTKDQKKTEVLQALGWKVIRIRHGKEVTPSHLAAILEEY